MMLRRLIRMLLRGYQLLLSPLLGQHCRFYPSCSQYAIEAVEQHGSLPGLWLATKRLLRCHPWHPGGVDPVPPVTRRSDCGCEHGSASPDRQPDTPPINPPINP